MKQIMLPALRPAGCVEACGAPLAYVAWLAYPKSKKSRDDCFLGGMASITKAAKVRKPDRPDALKGMKRDRVDAKVNDAFRVIYRDRWRAVSMAAWQAGEDTSQLAAAKRLIDWSRDPTGLSGDDDNAASVRRRIWRNQLPILPMAYGFFHATGFGAMPKAEIITSPNWVPVACELAREFAVKLVKMDKKGQFIIPHTNRVSGQNLSQY